MRFKEGDIVKISKNSKWYGWNAYNPKDVEGEVVELVTEFAYPVRVIFNGNNTDTVFEEKDLKLVRRPI